LKAKRSREISLPLPDTTVFYFLFGSNLCNIPKLTHYSNEEE
jgi:hypothetical protein